MSEQVLFYTHDPCYNFKQFPPQKRELKSWNLKFCKENTFFFALNPKICVSAALLDFEVM